MTKDLFINDKKAKFQNWQKGTCSKSILGSNIEELLYLVFPLPFSAPPLNSTPYVYMASNLSSAALQLSGRLWGCKKSFRKEQSHAKPLLPLPVALYLWIRSCFQCGIFVCLCKATVPEKFSSASGYLGRLRFHGKNICFYISWLAPLLPSCFCSVWSKKWWYVLTMY